MKTRKLEGEPLAQRLEVANRIIDLLDTPDKKKGFISEPDKVFILISAAMKIAGRAGAPKDFLTRQITVLEKINRR